jgi:hypothetical protein
VEGPAKRLGVGCAFEGVEEIELNCFLGLRLNLTLAKRGWIAPQGQWQYIQLQWHQRGVTLSLSVESGPLIPLGFFVLAFVSWGPRTTGLADHDPAASLI